MCAFVHKTWGKRERRIWTMDPSGAHAVGTGEREAEGAKSNQTSLPLLSCRRWSGSSSSYRAPFTVVFKFLTLSTRTWPDHDLFLPGSVNMGLVLLILSTFFSFSSFPTPPCHLSLANDHELCLPLFSLPLLSLSLPLFLPPLMRRFLTFALLSCSAMIMTATLARAFPEVDPSSPSSNRLRRRNSIGTTGLTHSPLDPSMMKPTTEHMAEERDAVLEEAKEEEQGLGKEVEEKQEALQNTTMTMGFWPEADPDGPVELTTRTLAIIGADTPPWQVDAHTKAQAVRLNNIISTISANHSMYCEHSGILGTRQVCPSSGYRIYANASVIETVAPYWISWKTWWRKLIPCSTPSSNTTRSIAIFHSPHRDIKVICT